MLSLAPVSYELIIDNIFYKIYFEFNHCHFGLLFTFDELQSPYRQIEYNF